MKVVKSEKHTITTIRAYLEQMKNFMGEYNPNAKTYYKLMLEEFEDMKCQELTDEEKNFVQRIINDIRISHPEFPANKECFYNCVLLAIFSKGKIKYCEGWSLDMIPIEHAWCRYRGKYFDPTALWNDRFNKDAQYFGKEIPLKTVVKHCWEDDGNTLVAPVKKIMMKRVEVAS